jgi:hypothetical protein
MAPMKTNMAVAAKPLVSQEARRRCHSREVTRDASGVRRQHPRRAGCGRLVGHVMSLPSLLRQTFELTVVQDAGVWLNIQRMP